LPAVAAVGKVAAEEVAVAPAVTELLLDLLLVLDLPLQLQLEQVVLDQLPSILQVETMETILFFQLLRQQVEVTVRLLIAEQAMEVQVVMVALVEVEPKGMQVQQEVLVIHHQQVLVKVITVEAQ
jgi:hypothetical protein